MHRMVSWMNAYMSSESLLVISKADWSSSRTRYRSYLCTAWWWTWYWILYRGWWVWGLFRVSTDAWWKRFIKSVCSSFKKESGLLEYLTAKEEKDVMICGIMTDFCINATVEAGFEHGLHMIVPAYANSTQDNEYMTREQAYHYYNEFLWPERYADCVPMDRALELLKKWYSVNGLCWIPLLPKYIT